MSRTIKSKYTKAKAISKHCRNSSGKCPIAWVGLIKRKTHYAMKPKQKEIELYTSIDTLLLYN
jgi:hypothetical protein